LTCLKKLAGSAGDTHVDPAGEPRRVKDTNMVHETGNAMEPDCCCPALFMSVVFHNGAGRAIGQNLT